MGDLREYNDGATDNSRWEHFRHRPGDVIVATPAKCGTTWTQTIVSELLFPHGDCPRPVLLTSPWFDGRLEPIEAVAKRVERQTHRRFVKTHTPGDGVPFWPDVFYIVVIRDGRDAYMSFLNHQEKMRAEVSDRVDAEARAAGGTSRPRSSDPHDALPDWLASPDANVATYLASWWPRRGETNVLFVHYNDLKVDLAGEMRRVGDFLGASVPDDLWPDVVERCTFESMRARGDEIAPFDVIFEGGVKSFLFKGTNGRWRDVMTDTELKLWADCVAENLTAEAADWMEQGSLAAGFRP